MLYPQKNNQSPADCYKITILGEVPGEALGPVWEAVPFLAV